MGKRSLRKLNGFGIITKNQLETYTSSLLRYFYLYCVEKNYIEKDTNFDDWCLEVHKYFKYAGSVEHFEKMSFDEFKKGYDIA